MILNLHSQVVVLSFASVDETPMCDHSVETYREILSFAAVCFVVLCKMKSCFLLGVKWYVMLTEIKLYFLNLFLSQQISTTYTSLPLSPFWEFPVFFFLLLGFI